MAENSGKKKIMVAIDESDCSHYALEWAIQNLKDSILNSQFFVFTAQPNSDFSYAYASTMGAAPIELIRSIQENHNKLAVTLLQKAKDICSKHGIIAETLTEIGEPKEAICEAAEKYDIQLLVLGSHSRGAIQRAFLGSVSNYCVHNAKCPVLVVKQPAV